MTRFSSSERLIASILSYAPGFKRIVKNIYIRLSYVLHRKDYTCRLLDSRIVGGIRVIPPCGPGDEDFFGYYDKSPDNGHGMVIMNETGLPTCGLPSAAHAIDVCVRNLLTGATLKVGATSSYNWQQGCRAHWISENRLVYNIFDNGRYHASTYDIDCRVVTATFDRPVQDSFRDIFFLSINYRRIMRLSPDYGYRNLPKMTSLEIGDLDSDGIWKTDFKTGETSLVVSLSQLASLSPLPSFDTALHQVNHVMISPEGSRFIFIHRWYTNGKRHDRLVLSDFSTLRVMADEDMVSHLCWVDENTLFGYLRHAGKDGFFFISTDTGAFAPCDELNKDGFGDGHPSCNGRYIVVDTYPDKSRMQHLRLYDIAQHEAMPLLEVFNPVKYQGETRCDMHPRFSKDGKAIFFDTVCEGSRRLAYVDISEIVRTSHHDSK